MNYGGKAIACSGKQNIGLLDLAPLRKTQTDEQHFSLFKPLLPSLLVEQ